MNATVTMTKEQVLAALPVNTASSSKAIRDYAIQHRVPFDLKDAWNVVLRKIQEAALRKAGL